MTEVKLYDCAYVPLAAWALGYPPPPLEYPNVNPMSPYYLDLGDGRKMTALPAHVDLRQAVMNVLDNYHTSPCVAYRARAGSDRCVDSGCGRCWPDAQVPEPDVSKAELLAALIRIEAKLVELTRPPLTWAEATITYPGGKAPNPPRCRHCGEVIVSRVVAEGERYWRPGVELGMWHHAETDRQECHAPAEVPPVCTYCGGALRMQQGSGEDYYYCGKITGLWVHAETGSEDCPE